MGKHKDWADRNISFYYITEVLNNLFFLIPVYVAFQNQYLTLTQMALLASARYVLMFLMELPTGVFADIWGRKVSCAIGAFIDAFGLFLIAFFPSTMMIIVGTMIRAVGESAMSGANSALIYDTLKESGREEEYVKVAARESMLVQAGLIAATFLGGFMYSISNTLPFLMTGASMFVSVFLYLNMHEPHIDTIKYSWSSYLRKTKDGLKELTKTPYTKYLSMYFMFIAGISWSWMTYLNLVYLNSLGFDQGTQGVILSVIRTVNAVTIGAVAVWVLKFTRKNGAWIHPILMALGSVLALVPNSAVNVVAIIPLMFVSTLRFNLLGKLTNEVFDSRHRATALSALNLLLGVLYSIIVAVSGPLSEIAHPRWIYFWTGIAPLPIIVWLVLKMKENHSMVMKTV